jgi:hypothetical protein
MRPADDVAGPGGDEPPEGPVDLVASVGALDALVVLLRDFLPRAGAVRAVALVEQPGSEGPVVIDCGRLLPVEVRWADHAVHLPHAIELDAVAPAVPHVQQLPRFEVDAEAGQIASPLGGLEHYALAVKSLAAILGGENVALVTFETTDPDTPLSVSARGDDPVVLSLGDEQFEMEPGWP